MVESDILLSQGHSYSTVLRWEVEPIVRVPITGITCPLGAARISTAPTEHGILDGWRTAIVSVVCPKELNADDPNRIRDTEYYAATVIDPTTVELNGLNIAALKTYTSGGFIQFNTPASLIGVTIRVRLKTKKGGVVLASNLVDDAPLDVLVTTIDLVKHTVELIFPVEATELLAGKTGWYDVEAVTADVPARVTALVSGTVKVEKE